MVAGGRPESLQKVARDRPVTDESRRYRHRLSRAEIVLCQNGIAVWQPAEPAVLGLQPTDYPVHQLSRPKLAAAIEGFPSQN